MKIIILCPYGVRTGGPEALHQLGATLIDLGIEAYMWYTIDSDYSFMTGLNKNSMSTTSVNIGNRENIIDEYVSYQVPSLSEVIISSETVFVIPETYIHWLHALPNTRVVVWWLSVDNAFGSLGAGGVNLNQLRRKNIIHAYQSNYARKFIEAVDFRKSFELTDYTKYSKQPSLQEKKLILINAGSKVIFDLVGLERLIAERIDVKLVHVKGLSRQEIQDAFSRAYCFIDLGNFPGKDRMARECALYDCVPIVLNVGGAKDYNIPEILKLEVDQLNVLPFIVESAVKNHDLFLSMIRNFVASVKLEKLKFFKEVTNLISKVKED